MKRADLLSGLLLVVFAIPAQAQNAAVPDPTAADPQLVEDCALEANRDNDECLLLPPVEEATNFVFALGPLLPAAAGLGLIAALASGGSSSPSTSP